MNATFRVSRSVFEFEAIDRIALPSYAGSTFRGGFGHAFKKTACALRHQTCDACLLREKCVYSYVFETPPPADTLIMRKYPRAPHPFVLEPPENGGTEYQPGERLHVGLILVGKAIDYFPYFIYGFEVLGEMGVGRGKGRFAVREAHAALPPGENGPGSTGRQGGL